MELTKAIIMSDAKTVKTLLKSGENINKHNSFNAIPLHYSCVLGHLAITKLLLIYGSNINLKDNQGFSSLRYILDKKHHNLEILFHKYRHFLNKDDERVLKEKIYRCCLGKENY